MRRSLTPEERRARIARLERWAHALDEQFRVPGIGFRFGWDSILGLIPGFGDTAMGIFSAALALEARRLGIPGVVQARMMGNVILDALVGAIPFLGDLFDFVWKANTRNLALLKQHIDPSARPSRGDWVFVTAFLVVIAIALAIPLMLMAALIAILGSGPAWQVVLGVVSA